MAALDVRAGLPPTAVEMLERMSRIRGLDQMAGFWKVWVRREGAAGAEL